ncbi:MAG: DUF1269 domain-containing protein [Nocardiopsaceae bacterium]|nr:DUF1269 domain-containing protein [Nocardiopsaceae bacterium]
MPTTAWRFNGTEGADAAVLTLQELDSQNLIEVQDVAVLRWPRYATEPIAMEHVTQQGGMLAAQMSKLKHGVVERSVIESVKGDMAPGTSALVLQSVGAAVDKVAQAMQGHDMELIRSDLSVQQQDQIRNRFRREGGAGS